ncbi:hypothetical protein ACLQ9F_14730 [Bordetella avium]|uniref:hypothetical protein n=1 Tax=Bordetella avium TaxID=521 RepID=UPI000E6A082B|nr:hypothetical protein [Bordetella avium]AZY48275.1 hypothetical protein C0J09_03350 [Bordetella avium]AZY51660.1 hypothetical protein C0J07_03405 [Bordetella avium]RIQ16566.1 hypothetical protein D0850_14395 [Bordetella avium]RIQ67568.1 hypothetical protein D0839_13680 [Bordetella avium]
MKQNWISPQGLAWRALGGLLFSANLTAAQAGGALVVDDADVETPGHCHVETWASHYGTKQGLGHLGMACTPSSLPSLELGMQGEYTRDRSDHGLGIGPTFKWNLLPSESGVGVALSGNAQWNTRRDRMDAGALLIPVSIPLGDKLNLNLNVGWSHDDGADRRDAYTEGVQLAYTLNETLSLIGETFRRQGDPRGYQGGLRLTRGDMDVDFLYGHYVDGAHTQAYTLGLTWHY